MAILFANIVTRNWRLAQFAEMPVSMRHHVEIWNLRKSSKDFSCLIRKRLKWRRIASKLTRYIVPKTPNVRGNINQETRQVAIQLSNDIVEDGENMDWICRFAFYFHSSWHYCLYLYLQTCLVLETIRNHNTYYTNLSRLAPIEGVRAINTFYFFIAILKWPFQRNMFQKIAKN